MYTQHASLRAYPSYVHGRHAGYGTPYVPGEAMLGIVHPMYPGRLCWVCTPMYPGGYAGYIPPYVPVRLCWVYTPPLCTREAMLGIYTTRVCRREAMLGIYTTRVCRRVHTTVYTLLYHPGYTMVYTLHTAGLRSTDGVLSSPGEEALGSTLRLIWLMSEKRASLSPRV